MSGRSLDHGLVIGYPRLLRGLWNAIDIRTKRNNRFARAPGRGPSGRNSEYPSLYFEALLFQNSSQVLGGLKLLESELAIAEDLIHHDLRLGLHGFDIAA